MKPEGKGKDAASGHGSSQMGRLRTPFSKGKGRAQGKILGNITLTGIGKGNTQPNQITSKKQ